MPWKHKGIEINLTDSGRFDFTIANHRYLRSSLAAAKRCIDGQISDKTVRGYVISRLNDNTYAVFEVSIRKSGQAGFYVVQSDDNKISSTRDAGSLFAITPEFLDGIERVNLYVREANAYMAIAQKELSDLRLNAQKVEVPDE